MRKYLFLFLSLLIFISPKIVFAESTDSANSLFNRNQIREEKRETIASRTAFLSQVRKERIRAYFVRMVTRIEAAITRLNKLIERMEARIAAIETGDKTIDTATAKKDISDAKVAIGKAKTDLDTAKIDIETVLIDEKPKEAFKIIITTVTDIKKSLVKAHLLLVHAIGNIKGLRVGSK